MAVAEVKYEQIHPVPHALSGHAVAVAMARCYGCDLPRLNVSQDDFVANTGRFKIPVEVVVDKSLAPNEWYVEFAGRRFGSIGC